MVVLIIISEVSVTTRIIMNDRLHARGLSCCDWWGFGLNLACTWFHTMTILGYSSVMIVNKNMNIIMIIKQIHYFILIYRIGIYSLTTLFTVCLSLMCFSVTFFHNTSYTIMPPGGQNSNCFQPSRCIEHRLDEV